MTDDEPTPIRPPLPEPTPIRDQVDQAIAQVDARAQAPAPAVMAEIPVMLQSTGRPCILAVPVDVTPAEVLELVGWMASSLRAHIAANDRPASPLVDALGGPLIVR